MPAPQLAVADWLANVTASPDAGTRTVVGGCARGRSSAIAACSGPYRGSVRASDDAVHRLSGRPVRLRLVVVASAGTSAILRQRPR